MHINNERSRNERATTVAARPTVLGGNTHALGIVPQQKTIRGNFQSPMRELVQFIRGRGRHVRIDPAELDQGWGLRHGLFRRRTVEGADPAAVEETFGLALPNQDPTNLRLA